MSSPAERYAASRRRSRAPGLSTFATGYPFGLDPFQVEACERLEAGGDVLVAAPTGAGKTVVGEFAVHLALAAGRKCFYTTPIKALSNQKFADLVARHGASNVGLLTGDTAIRSEAPVVVMTTEVLRNMLYAGSKTLDGLSHVVMDEVHYLSDRARGAVWEEVIIHLDPSVRLVSLSATVSNAEEFGAWLQTVRGDTHLVVEEVRPVPLWQHVLAGPRLYDLYDDAAQTEVNDRLVRLAREDARLPQGRPGGAGPRGRPRSLVRTPSRPDMVERLDAEGLLPAIDFVFSRAGCDAAVEQCLRSGLRLVDDARRPEIRRIAEEGTAAIPESDLRVLGYWSWLEGLERGIAAHHAGLVPAFKEVVEKLFLRGFVRMVFATETLALGINMPARSVVLEKLVKWNGETHADVTAGEYTQLTGRAGRRGIDVEGHAVVLWTPGFDPTHLAGLASTRTYPLRSSFRPTYNMATNLVAQVGRAESRTMLEQSFAQFQADRAVVGLARQVARSEEALAGYRASADCHLGDVGEYDAIRRRLSDREGALARDGAASRRAESAASLERLRPGDVVHVPSGRRGGVAVVVAEGPTVVTADRQVRRLTPVEVPLPLEPLGRVKVPKHFNARSPHARRDLVSTLRAQGFLDYQAVARPRTNRGDDAEVLRLRAVLRAHPVHGCSDRAAHLRWLNRAAVLEKENHALRARVDARSGGIARTFDRVCGVLDELGYLDGDTVTDPGGQLARIYGEADLVVTECLRAGHWEGLDAPGLAAVVSSLVYEPRRDEPPAHPPPTPCREAMAATQRTWAELAEVEARHRLDTLRRPDPGLSWAVHRWASGAALETVLGGDEILPGDFVRWCKQLVDLLGQLSGVGAGPVSAVAKSAAELVRRGVVAYA